MSVLLIIARTRHLSRSPLEPRKEQDVIIKDISSVTVKSRPKGGYYSMVICVRVTDV
jgi:hypothetical protein